MSGMQCHTYLLLMLSLESNMSILVVFLSCTSLTIALQERPSKWFRLLLDFLTPHIMFVLVSWARVQRHICSRMHIHTRAYVTKKKPHVHDRCHTCPIASSCPTAPVDIRPRPPMNLAAPQLVSAGAAATAPGACLQCGVAPGLGPRSCAAGQLALCRRRPNTGPGPTCKGTGTPSIAKAGQARQASAKQTRPNKPW